MVKVILARIAAWLKLPPIIISPVRFRVPALLIETLEALEALLEILPSSTVELAIKLTRLKPEPE